MSDIALYNVLTKLGAKHEEAEKAVADVASLRDVATKMDIEKLKGEFKTEMAKLETRMTWKLVGIGLAIIAAIKYL